ncbi:hypothetical protein DASC09_008850 [Saccharomycopsis crataegensis]|uniref:CENP-T/Histone H4 histone fold domain-containing protein n=1 Tax=Saccharomycopsis crataegensis TaxID=43959 RepID=A0AAV5QGP1_9ASCO|nr:hypothetical protein DASC09_008850 [Saccharomycopsis crataegensis]
MEQQQQYQENHQPPTRHHENEIENNEEQTSQPFTIYQDPSQYSSQSPIKSSIERLSQTLNLSQGHVRLRASLPITPKSRRSSKRLSRTPRKIRNSPYARQSVAQSTNSRPITTNVVRSRRRQASPFNDLKILSRIMTKEKNTIRRSNEGLSRRNSGNEANYPNIDSPSKQEQPNRAALVPDNNNNNNSNNNNNNNNDDTMITKESSSDDLNYNLRADRITRTKEAHSSLLKIIHDTHDSAEFQIQNVEDTEIETSRIIDESRREKSAYTSSSDLSNDNFVDPFIEIELNRITQGIKDSQEMFNGSFRSRFSGFSGISSKGDRHEDINEAKLQGTPSRKSRELGSLNDAISPTYKNIDLTDANIGEFGLGKDESRTRISIGDPSTHNETFEIKDRTILSDHPRTSLGTDSGAVIQSDENLDLFDYENPEEVGLDSIVLDTHDESAEEDQQKDSIVLDNESYEEEQQKDSVVSDIHDISDFKIEDISKMENTNKFEENQEDNTLSPDYAYNDGFDIIEDGLEQEDTVKGEIEQSETVDNRSETINLPLNDVDPHPEKDDYSFDILDTSKISHEDARRRLSEALSSNELSGLIIHDDIDDFDASIPINQDELDVDISIGEPEHDFSNDDSILLAGGFARDELLVHNHNDSLINATLQLAESSNRSKEDPNKLPRKFIKSMTEHFLNMPSNSGDIYNNNSFDEDFLQQLHLSEPKTSQKESTISDEILDLICDFSDTFLNNQIGDLSDFADHAQRKTININDMIFLIQRSKILDKNNTLSSSSPKGTKLAGARYNDNILNSIFSIADEFCSLENLNEIETDLFDASNLGKLWKSQGAQKKSQKKPGKRGRSERKKKRKVKMK